MGPGKLEEGLCEPGTAAATWVQTHVLDDLPAWVAQALPQVGELEVVVPDLIDLPVSADEHTAASAVRWLRRTGLLVPLPARRAHAAGHTLVPLLRSVILRGADAPHRRDPDRLRRTACWYAANGHPAPAARALVAAGDPRAAA